MENDLIRRSATAKDLREYAERKAQVNGIEYANGILVAACRIEQALPAVDAVAVVRCFYCRHWQEPRNKKTAPRCKLLKTAMHASDSCNYGQRREDGDA